MVSWHLMCQIRVSTPHHPMENEIQKKKKTVETEKKTVAGRRGNPVIIIIHFLEPWTWAGRKFYVKLISPASTGPFTLHHPVSLSFSLSLSISFGDTVDSPHFSQDVRVFVRTHKSVSWLFFFVTAWLSIHTKIMILKSRLSLIYRRIIRKLKLPFTHAQHTHTHTPKYAHQRVSKRDVVSLPDGHVSLYLLLPACVVAVHFQPPVCQSPRSFEAHSLFVDISLRLLSFREPFFNLGFIYYPQMYLSVRFLCSLDNTRTHQNHFLRLSESRNRWQVCVCCTGPQRSLSLWQKDIPSPAIINKIKCAFVWTNWIMCVWMPRFHCRLPFLFPVFLISMYRCTLYWLLNFRFLCPIPSWWPVKFYCLSKKKEISLEMASIPSTIHPSILMSYFHFMCDVFVDEISLVWSEIF